MPNRASKILLVALILSTATAVWVPRQISLAKARNELAEAKARRLALNARIAAATADLEPARRELRTQNTTQKQTHAAVAKAEAELNNAIQDSRWISPPQNLPDWNDDSPYVWLRKEVLSKLLAQQPLLSFASTGAVSGHAASLLVMDEKERTAANAKLMRIMGDYHALELANAQTTTEHLPEGTKVTVRILPLPEQGTRLEDEFKTALRTEVGAQRADMLLQSSQSWLDHQFSQADSSDPIGPQPRAITVLCKPDGNYSFTHTFDSPRGPINYFSTSGTWSMINRQIPAHLLNLFDSIAPPPTTKSSSTKN